MSPLRSARSFNPLPIGLGFIALVVVAFYLSFNITKLPLLGSGTTYTAAFTEAAGLRPDNDVRIGGVKVGAIESVSLEDQHVRVEFTVDGTELGDQTRASIEIGTLLGNKFLSLQPAGTGTWDPQDQLPLAQTTAPYDIVPAFATLTTSVQEIDTGQLAEAFTTLADTFRGSPPEIRGALDGLSRLSKTITSRDTALSQLLGRTQRLTGILAEQRTQVTEILGDGTLLLQELDARRDDIRRLFVQTAALSSQLIGLVEDNREAIGPALGHLQKVTTILADNQNNLEETFRLLYPTTRSLSEAVGSGPWFDAILQNFTLLPETALGDPLPQLPVPQTIGDLLGISGGTP